MKLNEKTISNKQKNEKPSVEELIQNLLTGEIKDNLIGLINFFKGLKLAPCWYATNAFNFKYKGKIILRFTLGGGTSNIANMVDIFFTVANKKDLEIILNKLPDDMLDFYFKNMRLCVRCNPNHGNGGTTTLLNKKVEGLCVLGEMRFINPTIEQIEYIKKFTFVRRAHILDDSKM